MSELIICPMCGFSFRYLNFKTEKGKIRCPMCGHEFGDLNIFPFAPKRFDKNF